MSPQYRLEYLYRDFSNFKAYGEVCISQAQLDKIIQEADVSFVPTELGIPPLQRALQELTNGPTDQDHERHEVVRVVCCGEASAPRVTQE